MELMDTEMSVNVGIREENNTPIRQHTYMKCDMCEVTCLSQMMYSQHLKGSKHQKKLKRMEVERLWAEKDPSVYCSICDCAMEPSVMTGHLVGARHRAVAEGKLRNDAHGHPAVTEGQPPEKSEGQTDNAPMSLMPESKDEPMPESQGEVSSEIQCKLCGVSLTDMPVANIHFNSQQHISKCMEAYFEHKKSIGKNSEDSFYCEVCDVRVIGQVTYDAHVRGFKHNFRVTDGNFDPDSPFAAKSMKVKEKREKHRELMLVKKLKIKERRKKIKELNKAKKLQTDVKHEEESSTANTQVVEPQQQQDM